jgi:protease-4
MTSARQVTLNSFAIAALAALLGATPDARASEPMPTRAERILSPGRSAASEDSVEAMVLNPANLAFQPAPEFRWTGVRCPDTKKVGCGHAFSLASPLLFNIATGLRVDYITPPDTAGFPYNGFDYTWITWGLAYKFSDFASFGMSLQRSYSVNAVTDGLFGISAGLSIRPNTHFAFSLIAHDFNGPSVQTLPPSGLPVLDRSYVLAAAFRPTGRREVELGLDLKCLDIGDDKCLQGGGQYQPRVMLGVDIPGVGRARGDVEVAHLPNDERRGIVGTAGLEIYIGGFSAGGGALFGSGLGNAQSVGEYATASISAYDSPGIFRHTHAVYFRLEKTPSVRGHVALLRRLWKLSEDPDVTAVTLVLRAEPADSFAHAEELADAIRVLRARKKKVLCSWEDAGNKSLYVCANADRIVLNPSGGLRYAGLRSQYFYLAGLMSKLGIKAEFVRIGAHKSAPEQFTNEHASDVARADHEDMLRENEAVFVRNVAVGRKLSEAHVRQVTANGPFIASEAREAGFIDGTAFDDEVERATQELVGQRVSYEKYEDETTAPVAFGPRDKVAVVYIDGDIVDGRSSHIPILDMSLVGSYSIAETIKQLKDDGSVKSVVLRIESPGGSSMASDVMWREIDRLAQRKPVIVSMGSVAASGGYYIASPARTIYALPLTVTGSIGIFYGKADISELMNKIGLTMDTYKTAPRADAESIFRPFTDDERRALDIKVHQFYDVFLDRVAKGRHMSTQEVDNVGQGRVWTGQEALERRLVDKMGGLRQALIEARRAGGLPDDAPILELPVIEKTLFDTALELAGVKSGAPLVEALPQQVKDVARAVAPMAIYDGSTPLARLEWVSVESP